MGSFFQPFLFKALRHLNNMNSLLKNLDITQN